MQRLALRIGLALCALLVFVVATYPAAFSTLSTNDGYLYEHTVVSSSSAEYADRMEDVEQAADTEAVDLRERRYGELTPEAQAMFDRTLDEPPGDRGVHTYTPTVCKSGVYACPHTSKDNLPPELAYDRGVAPTNAAIIVTTEDGRYLFMTFAATDQSSDYGWALGNLPFIVLVVPTVLLLATLAIQPSKKVRYGVALLGSLPVVLFAVSTPGPTSVLFLVAGAFLVPVPVLLAPSDYETWIGAIAIAMGVVLAMLAIVPAYVDAYVGLSRSSAEWMIGLVLSWGGPVAIWALDAGASRIGDGRERSVAEGGQ